MPQDRHFGGHRRNSRSPVLPANRHIRPAPADASACLVMKGSRFESGRRLRGKGRSLQGELARPVRNQPVARRARDALRATLLWPAPAVRPLQRGRSDEIPHDHGWRPVPMRQRFMVNDEGMLVDRHGYVLGRTCRWSAPTCD
jgi:hypothetical protein